MNYKDVHILYALYYNPEVYVYTIHNVISISIENENNKKTIY